MPTFLERAPGSEEADQANENGEREPDMAVFRSEIASLIPERAPELNESKVSKGMRDLLFVNPDELTVEDAKMWRMIRDNPDLVTPARFNKYIESTEGSKNSSRKYFRAALGNKLQRQWAEDSIKNN